MRGRRREGFKDKIVLQNIKIEQAHSMKQTNENCGRPKTIVIVCRLLSDEEKVLALKNLE